MSAGPRGQNQCRDRRSLQEVDHNGGRSAHFWFICIVGGEGEPLRTWAGLHIPHTAHLSYSVASLHTPAPQLSFPSSLLLLHPSLFEQLLGPPVSFWMLNVSYYWCYHPDGPWLLRKASLVTSMGLLMYPSPLAFPGLAVYSIKVPSMVPLTWLQCSPWLSS